MEGVNILPSVEIILAGQRAQDMPTGMVNTAIIELLNEEKYEAATGQDVRGPVMAVVRPLAFCCLRIKDSNYEQELWKNVISFLHVKRNHADADGCQALIFIIRRLRNKFAKGILISLLAHLYNILRQV